MPIVSTDIFAVPEIVEDGKNGFLFSAEDQHSFQDKLQTLVDAEPLRKKYGATSMAISQEISSTETIAETMTLKLLQHVNAHD